MTRFFQLSIVFLLFSCVVNHRVVDRTDRTEVRSTEIRHIIFLIGDGMGFEHVKAGGYFVNGAAGTLVFESFPAQAQVTTYSADDPITDSAAAATAFATGIKVNNGVLSLAIPGDSHELETLLELSQSKGLSVGLVTTTYMTHATPAAFGAHETSRNNTAQIAVDYTTSRPNVLFGGGGHGMSSALMTNVGYTVVTSAAQLNALDTEQSVSISGQFGSDHLPYEYDGLGSLPHLSEMASVALDILDNDPDGFFVMIEGGRIDHAAHANDISRNVQETAEFNNTVQVVLDWAAGRTDTLILVTADHETGGLTVLSGNGQNNPPTVSWSTTGHSSTNVPLYAWGSDIEDFTGVLNNTEVQSILSTLIQSMD